jgi:hypothetical protein
MSETLIAAAPTNAEIEVEKPSLSWQSYEQLTGPESMSQFAEKIDRESRLFDYESEIDNIEQMETIKQRRVKEIVRDSRNSDSTIETHVQQLAKQLNELEVRRKEAGRLHRFMEMRSHLWQTSKNKVMLFDALEGEIQPLIEGIVHDTPTQGNRFVISERFMEAADRTKPVIDIDARREPIKVPVAAIVSAQSFKSWGIGRGEGATKDGKSSSAVILDYARAKEIPDIDNAIALVQPDGRVIIMTENAHRVAAAKLRWQEFINIKRLSVFQAKWSVA